MFKLRRSGNLKKTFRQLSGELRRPNVAKRLRFDEGKSEEVKQALLQLKTNLKSTCDTIPGDLKSDLEELESNLREFTAISAESSVDEIVAFFKHISDPKEVAQWVKKMENWKPNSNAKTALPKVFAQFTSADKFDCCFAFLKGLPPKWLISFLLKIDLSTIKLPKDNFDHNNLATALLNELTIHLGKHYNKSAQIYKTDPFKLCHDDWLTFKSIHKTLGDILKFIERLKQASSIRFDRVVSTIKTIQQRFSMRSVDRQKNKDNAFKVVFDQAFRTEDGVERLSPNKHLFNAFPHWMKNASLKEKQECLEMLNSPGEPKEQCGNISPFVPTKILETNYKKHLAKSGNDLRQSTDLILKQFMKEVRVYLSRWNDLDIKIHSKYENQPKGEYLNLFTISSLEYYGIVNLPMLIKVIQNPKKIGELDPKKFQSLLGTDNITAQE